MKKERHKIIAISVYGSQWAEFRQNCSARYKTASGVVRELISEWNKMCSNDKKMGKR